MPRNHNPETKDAHDRLAGLTTPARDAYTCLAGEIIIGARLRAIRRKQKLSIRDLAGQCGLSANTLSLIENGHTSPSLHTLQRLSHGLGIPLATIFEEDRAVVALVYQKHGQRSLERFTQGTLEHLGAGLPPLGAEPILVTLDAHQAPAADVSHAGREFIYCLEGYVTCFILGQEYRLAPGDSLLFDAQAPHHWLNTHPAASRLLVLFCPMETRDQPGAQHLGKQPRADGLV